MGEKRTSARRGRVGVRDFPLETRTVTSARREKRRGDFPKGKKGGT